ncbi:hypothetical protein [Streptomyces clavifer]|uniref:hypothetical protein n=1 Tax=Streptomyces clavifer TaxID=68188 RepID=UPI0037F563E4
MTIKTKTFEAGQESSMKVSPEGFGSVVDKIAFQEGESSTSSESSSIIETWEADGAVHGSVIRAV